MNISAAKTYIELLVLSRSMVNGKKMYEFQKRCLDGIYICLRGDYIQDPETGKMMGSRPSEKVDKSGDSGIIKEIKEIGIRGDCYNIPPKPIDVSKLKLNDNHTNVIRKHSVTEQEAKSFIENADISVTRKLSNNAVSENYYSQYGAAYVKEGTNNDK